MERSSGMKKTISLLGLVLTVAVLPAAAEAAVYEVGPGLSCETIGDVPWESLEPGDVVMIHWREDPYKEKWVIGRSGTAESPITVSGVPGPGGELPVIDGSDATTRSDLDFWNEERGVIKIGGSNNPPDTTPSYIIIENLDVRSGRPPYGFTGRDGASAYQENAASIYIEKGQHVTIRNCVIHDSGNGLFVGAFDGETQDILVESCRIYDNGIEGSIYEHNSYTAAIGITFQFNAYGPLRDGCGGNSLKDRSAGTVVRYNWIEGGNRQLDLVDAEDSDVLVTHPAYHETFVYGNILIEPEGAGNSQILHYGGDSDSTDIYRKGTLYFYNNTVVSTRTGNTTLMRLSTNDETADVRNNVVFVTASGSSLAMSNAAGIIHLRGNWMNEGWVDSHSGLEGEIIDDGGNVTGETPGFEDFAAQDFHLASSSTCRDAGGELAAQVLPDNAVVYQYVRHAGAELRPVDGTLDIGAFEYGTVPTPEEGAEPLPEAVDPTETISEAVDPSYDGRVDASDVSGEEGEADGDGGAGCGCRIAL
jgi:hypothetical protein